MIYLASTDVSKIIHLITMPDFLRSGCCVLENEPHITTQIF